MCMTPKILICYLESNKFTGENYEKQMQCLRLLEKSFEETIYLQEDNIAEHYSSCYYHPDLDSLIAVICGQVERKRRSAEGYYHTQYEVEHVASAGKAAYLGLSAFEHKKSESEE